VGAQNGIAGVHRNETPVALECIISWCVKSVKSMYGWGSYSEEVTHIFVNSTRGDFPWSSTPFTSPTLNGTDIYYNEDINIEVLSTNGISSCYGVSNETMVQTVAMFDDIFPSYVTARSISEEPLM
jgi:hypothetical protein